MTGSKFCGETRQSGWFLVELFPGLSIMGLGSVEMWHSASPRPAVLQQGETRGLWWELGKCEIWRSPPAPSLRLFNQRGPAALQPSSLLFPRLL